MTVRYSIRNWNERFEKAQGRKYDKLSWVAFPNKHDGLGFRRIMAMPNGMVVYAAWCLIVQIASKCQTRGVLADENGPFDTIDFAAKTGAPKENFDEAVKVLCDRKIGWLLVENYEPAPTTPPLQDRTEQNNTGQDKTLEVAPPPTDSEVTASESELRDWLIWWNTLQARGLVAAAVNVDQPSQGAIAGWNRWKKSRRLRTLLADRDAVRREIEASSFCRKPWFDFGKLMGGNSRGGTNVAEKLLEGGYRDYQESRPNRQGAGQDYDPAAAEKDKSHGTF